MDKNQILRTYGVPDRTMDDGSGGTVLIYENFSQTTISSSSAYRESRSKSNGSITYGYGKTYGNSNTNSSAEVNSIGSSHTFNTKTFRNIYLKSNNVAYDYQTNFGGNYSSTRCLNKGQTWLFSFCFLTVFAPLVAIPVILKAKKMGKYANKNSLLTQSLPIIL